MPLASRRYAIEVVQVIIGGFPGALLAAGDLDGLRDLLEHSLPGAALDDNVARAAVAAFFAGGFGAWKTDDGHCFSTLDTWLLTVRGLAALVEENTDARRAVLREWLPPPAECLRIAEHECGWRAYPTGAAHPALLFARLRGERLGEWAAAAEVAEGVLAIEVFNPVLRTEASRLLGCALAEGGDWAGAHEAAERAAAEAACARYAWLEALSLRDALRWCAPADEVGVRGRLRSAVGRLAASAEEVERECWEGLPQMV